MRFGAGYLALWAIAGQTCYGTGTDLDSAQSTEAKCYSSRRAEIAAVLSTAQRVQVVVDIFDQARTDCLRVAREVLTSAALFVPAIDDIYNELLTNIQADMEMAQYLVEQKIAFDIQFPMRRNPDVDVLVQMRDFVGVVRAHLQNRPGFNALLQVEMDRWQAAPNDLNLSQLEADEYWNRAMVSFDAFQACAEDIANMIGAGIIDAQANRFSMVDAMRVCSELRERANMDIINAKRWVLDRDIAPYEAHCMTLDKFMQEEPSEVHAEHAATDQQRSIFMTSLLEFVSRGEVGARLRARAEWLAEKLLRNLTDSHPLNRPYISERLTADPFAIIRLPEVNQSTQRDVAVRTLRNCVERERHIVSRNLAAETIDRPHEMFGLPWDCAENILVAAKLSCVPPEDRATQEFVGICRGIVQDAYALRRTRELEEMFSRRDPFAAAVVQPHQHAMQPEIYQQGLGEFLRQFSDKDVDSMCDALEHLYQLIHDSVTTHAAASQLARWNEVYGPHLLALASIKTNECHKKLLRAALALATNIPGTSISAAAFAVDSGLGEFCDQNGIAIRTMLEADTPWELLSSGAWNWDSGDYDGNQLVDAFAAYLPRYCPQVPASIKSKAAVVHQYFFRQRLSAHLHQPHIDVERAQVFQSSIAFLNGPVAHLLAGLPQVSYLGELGADAGGLGRDWFATLVKAVFETPGSLFKVHDGGKHLMLDEAKLCTDETREFYRATGRLLAFILASRLPASIPLPVPFFALLLGSQVSREVLCQQSEYECNGFNEIQIAIESGDEETKRNAMNLDHDERILTLEEFIQSRIDYYVTPLSDAKMEAIRSGFNDLVPIDYVRAFLGPQDLRDLISVDEDIEAEDLIKYTDFQEPLTAESPEVQWLFNWLRAADQDMRRKYVQFITGLPTLPLGGAEALGKRFEILTGGEGLAPRSHTCFYQLELPAYSAETNLQQWFPLALSADGFGAV